MKKYREEIQAAFMRGGTSKGLLFENKHLPPDKENRDHFLLRAMGSPDACHRQLDGMGEGVSSLSKAVFVENSTSSGANIDYTFAQVSVDNPVVDYSANCGNLTAGVGPFAVEQQMISWSKDGETKVILYNTNTQSYIESCFSVCNGVPVEDGLYEIAGVSESGGPVSLRFINLGRASSSGLLPIGQVVDDIEFQEGSFIKASIIDACIPVVFVKGEHWNLYGDTPIEQIKQKTSLMTYLDKIRRKAGMLIGASANAENVPLVAPNIALVMESPQFSSLDGKDYRPENPDLLLRFLSMEKLHRAIPAIAAMCVAAAYQITGTIPNQFVPPSLQSLIRIGHLSGITEARSDVEKINGRWFVHSTSMNRTIRR